MKKILVTIGALSIGGTEKVLINLLSKIPKNYKVDVISFFDINELKIDFSKNISIKSLWHTDKKIIGKKEKIIMGYNLCSLNRARKLYEKNIRGEKYDVEICFSEWGLMPSFVAASSNKDSKKICWIHFDAKIKDYTIKGLYNFDKILENYYDRINCVSEYAKKNLLEKFPRIDKNKVHVVYNIDNPKEIIEKSNEYNPFFEKYNNKRNIVFVGRLMWQKGVDRLLEIHKELSDNSYILHIVGDGKEKKFLQKYQKQYNLKNIVWWGEQKNPYVFLKNAHLVVMPSRFEGLPTVMIETLHLSTPLIVTDVSGVREVADNLESVYITENNRDDFKKYLKLCLEKKKINRVRGFTYNWESSVNDFFEYLK